MGNRARRPGLWLAALAVAAGSISGQATGDPLEIPHRAGRLQADGDLGDWEAGGAEARFARPASAGKAGVAARVRLAWDREALWVAFEVSDPTFQPPPMAARGAALFQWDSVEVYLSGQLTGRTRMSTADFQVILAPDGRSAVLQGNPLLAEFEPLSVPKREREGVAIVAAGARTGDGYAVEARLPFAAFGIDPVAGRSLRLDLAVNDWRSGHEPFPMMVLDRSMVRRLDDKAPTNRGEFTENGLAADRARAAEQRAYRPWSWSGTGDFGHPADWRTVRLTGAAPLGERLADSVGLLRVVGLVIAVGACLHLLVATALGRRYRRRVAALLDRLASLEAAQAGREAAAAQRPSAGSFAPEPGAAAPPGPASPPVPISLHRSGEWPALADTVEERIAAAARAAGRPQDGERPESLGGARHPLRPGPADRAAQPLATGRRPPRVPAHPRAGPRRDPALLAGRADPGAQDARRTRHAGRRRVASSGGRRAGGIRRSRPLLTPVQVLLRRLAGDSGRQPRERRRRRLIATRPASGASPENRVESAELAPAAPRRESGPSGRPLRRGVAVVSSHPHPNTGGGDMQNTDLLRLAGRLGLALLLAATTAPSFAQQEAPPPPPAQEQPAATGEPTAPEELEPYLAEITVTAQKREENVQEVAARGDHGARRRLDT